MKRLAILFLMVAVSLSACSDDDESADVSAAKGIYIINEGAWGAVNASLSLFDPTEDKIYNDVFKNANNGAALGDVANSMTVYGNYGYVVVNGSDKVEVIRLTDHTRQQMLQLAAGFSPRHLVFASASKAYLSSLMTGSVAILSVSAGMLTQTGTISVGDNPEEIAISNGKAYVANSGFGMENTISVISTATDQVIKTVEVGDNPVNVQRDAHGRILALCWGQYGPNAVAKLMVIEPTTDTVIDSLIVAGGASELALGDEMGYIQAIGRVISFSLETYEVVQDPFISGNYYSLWVDPGNGDVYAGDPKDYQSRGDIYVFNADGTAKSGPHTAGIIPGGFAFVPKE